MNPTTINSCDGNTGYAGGTITVQPDGSVDVINTSTSSGLPYIVYALPDAIRLGRELEPAPPNAASARPTSACSTSARAAEATPGLSQPHFFSQAFQVHPDPTDSGTLNPGDGTFPADSAPAITSANHTTFTKGTAGTFSVTATGYGPPPSPRPAPCPPVSPSRPPTRAIEHRRAGRHTDPERHLPDHHHRRQRGRHAEPPRLHPDRQRGTGYHFGQPHHLHQGTAGSFTVTATGIPAPTLAESGPCPAGVTFTPGHRRAGRHPDAGRHLPDHLHRHQRGRLARHPELHPHRRPAGVAPTITSANHTTFTKGTAGTFTVTATGSPAPTFTETGPLPTGVTVHLGTGVLSGTPTASGYLPDHHHRRQRDHPQRHPELHPDRRPAAPAITSAQQRHLHQGHRRHLHGDRHRFPDAHPGRVRDLARPGSPSPRPACWAGTPTQRRLPHHLHRHQRVGSPATQSFTLTVLAPGFHISTTSLPNATVGVPYSVQLQTQGGTGPYKWKKTAKLPKGLSLSSTGLLSGTPSTKSVGTQSVGVTVTSNKTATASGTLPLVVDEAPAITSLNAVSFNDNTASSFTVTTTGFPAPTFSKTGTLPNGVTLSSAGVLSGTPVLPGSPPNTTVFPITITANNGIGSPSSQSFSLTVIAPVAHRYDISAGGAPWISL